MTLLDMLSDPATVGSALGATVGSLVGSTIASWRAIRGKWRADQIDIVKLAIADHTLNCRLRDTK